jgi:hypothetical protein
MWRKVIQLCNFPKVALRKIGKKRLYSGNGRMRIAPER